MVTLNDHGFVPAVPDPVTAGMFRVDRDRLTKWMPLSLFTDHVVGQSLRGQRMLWRSLCPVAPVADLPAGVEVEPLLIMPPSPGGAMWVTTNIVDLLERLQRREGLIEPSFGTDDEPGIDMPIPRGGLPVAVAATRRPAGAADRKQPVRIVVLAMADSLVDGYIDVEVTSDQGGAMVVGEPPRANADVVINGVYWLVGRDQQIAAPAHVGQPIQAVSEPTRMALWVICVVVAPLLVAGLGAVVMVVRRR